MKFKNIPIFLMHVLGSTSVYFIYNKLEKTSVSVMIYEFGSIVKLSKIITQNVILSVGQIQQLYSNTLIHQTKQFY